MEDRNHLELTEKLDSLTAYKNTAVCQTTRRFLSVAYTPSVNKDDKFHMKTLPYKSKDARQAAFVGQAWHRVYGYEGTYRLWKDGELLETAKEFIADLDIPEEFDFPMEGYGIDEICEGGYVTENNKLANGKVIYATNAKNALVIELKASGKSVPLTKQADAIKKTEALYNTGLTYLQAARQFVATL